MPAGTADRRIPVLYVAPWVDYAGSDTGTIDWFRWLDRERFRPSLITTQPSPNRRLAEVEPYASEVWSLPDLMPGSEFCGFILDFIHSRGVRVVHVMNSRIAFNLLPDLRRLPNPPATVVQLHVEEPDRSGYVRYVTTRFGNLVDAFAVSSHHLADAVVGYEVPRSKCHVVYTGVDAEWTFAPGRVQPVAGLAPDRAHILFVARLVDQKDPLLMVEVADRLRRRTRAFQLHCVGDGELEPQVRAAIAARGLGEHVLLHGPSAQMPGWYAASDVVLMTSAFEGVPYVVYEAMAMGVPLVAPALPGIRELMAEDSGRLVDPRDDADAYADALVTLIEDEDGRRRIAATARRRAVDRFSLATMGESFSGLYSELLGAAPPPMPTVLDGNGHRPSPIRLRTRKPYETPLVSVIIPCFNHGQFLEECLDSIEAQSYPQIEVIVVDDASTDPETVDVLDRVERRVRLLRLGRNSGPAAARNAAIAKARGRYVLPVDADNLLLPTAVAELVAQIQASGEQVGFIYPNQQFFGNRTDYHRAPRYNLHSLLTQNFCDTCSIIDREVFDHGVRYNDDIRFGHEDWDLVLQLAEREVYGEPARARTLLTRKAGFTRCDLVDHWSDEFVGRIRERHTGLFEAERSIKGRWSPALTLAPLAAVPEQDEALRRLRDSIAAQTCDDAEVVLRTVRAPDPVTDAPTVRRVHPELARDEADAIAAAVSMARGANLCLTRGWGGEVLGDRAGLEKLVRLLVNHPNDAVVLVDTGDVRANLARIDADDAARHPIVGVAWCLATSSGLGDVVVGGDDTLRDLVQALTPACHLRWHSLALSPRPEPSWRGGSAARTIPLGGVERTPAELLERSLRLGPPPRLPGLPDDLAPSWKTAGGWRPPLTRPLYRHYNLQTRRRTVTHSPRHHPGWVLEYELGSIQLFPLQGTRLLVITEDGGYRLAASDQPGDGEGLLGHLEECGILPLLDPVHLARHRETGEQVLVSGEDDPLLPHVDLVERLGFIEPHPVRPRASRTTEAQQLLVALDGVGAQLDDTTRRAEALQGQVDRIVHSIPARLYRKVMWVPGLRRLLLWRRGRSR